MAKADRILDLMPSFFRAKEATKLFREVVAALAAPIEEADSLLFRIQRAHRLNVAERTEDIVRLAGALDLDAGHFEDLINDVSLTYERRLDLMRQRVRRIARVHLKGLGTPWAVLEAAAIFLNAEIVPERIGDPLIKHVDPEGYSHKVILSFSSLPNPPREPLFLHESPLRRQKVDPVERWPLEAWALTNQSPDLAPIRVAIRGVGDRTVRPSVFSPTTESGVIFNGLVPDGQTLIIDSIEGATLDDNPVDDWVIAFHGAIADFSREGSAIDAIDEGVWGTPFDGRSSSEGAHRHLTPAPSGGSEWRFKVADAVYDAADFDLCALRGPADPIGIWDADHGFDRSVFEYPASGIVGMAWDERVACTFKLLLPPHVASPQPANDAAMAAASRPPSNPVTRIAGVMGRFKAAGIVALVDAAKEAWFLGSSVIRDGNATGGEGVEFHTTRLVNPRTELFVP